jgi:hypothetical protein
MFRVLKALAQGAIPEAEAFDTGSSLRPLFGMVYRFCGIQTDLSLCFHEKPLNTHVIPLQSVTNKWL